MKGSFWDKMFNFSGSYCIEVPVCDLCEDLDSIRSEQLRDGPPRDYWPVVWVSDQGFDNFEYWF